MSFEPGAPATGDAIPLCVPHLGGHEWEYVRQCLDGNWVSSVGPFVERFEQEMADRAGTRFAVATASGTAALHIALIVAGVEADDEVLVPALTFIAPANAVRYIGAWPVFMDVERDYWQMDAGKVAEFLTKQCDWRDGELRNRETGRRVKAILPVHILGHPVDMGPLLDIARRYDLTVIEDCAEALGALYKGHPVGGLGRIGCFSFNGNKIITTGGGGMIVTNDQTLAGRARYLTTQAKDDPLEYVHRQVGYNYRLTNIQAAMGCAQLEKLPEHVAAKRRIAERYAEGLANVAGISLMPAAPWAHSTYWLYTILVDEARYGMDSRALLRALAAQKIQTRPLWQPLHRSRAMDGCAAWRVEVADELCRRALSLPSSVGLTEEQAKRVIASVRDGTTTDTLRSRSGSKA